MAAMLTQLALTQLETLNLKLMNSFTRR